MDDAADHSEDVEDSHDRPSLAELREVGEKHPLLSVFTRFIEYRDDTVSLVNMSIAGAQILDRLGAVDVELGLTREKGAAKPDYSAHPKREIEEDFPLLRGHALVGLWGPFEAFHEDLAVEWVRARPSALSSASVMTLTVPLGEYEALDETERAVYLVRLLKQQSGLERQPGLGQFLPLLQKIGIFGTVADDVRRDILELQQTRHLWAHRGGWTDETFVSACPWRTDVCVGSRLHVTDDAFYRLTKAASSYVGGVFEWILPGFKEVYPAGASET